MWYRVFGYENGTVKYRDGGAGDAFFFHFVGEGRRPARLIQGNAVLSLGGVPDVFPDHASDQKQKDDDFGT